MTKFQRAADRAWCERIGERNERAARMRPRKPLWKQDAFWLVVMPTALVAVVFVVALVVRAVG